jgi:hypothetical protein
LRRGTGTYARMKDGWWGFSAWSAGGILFALGVVGAASVGLLLLPVAGVALIVIAARVRVWPEGLGAFEGLATVALLIGALNLGRTPCPRNGTLVLEPGQHEVSCGGLAPAPFLIVGFATALAAIAVYRNLRDRR